MGVRRVGLVLGAGGAVGHAFHAGVLAALHEGLGWDARGAEVVVGTSAGSGVAALLRAGLAPVDLFARSTGDRLSPEGARLLARSGPPVTMPPPTGPVASPSGPAGAFGPAGPSRSSGGRATALRMAAPGVFARAAMRPWNLRLGTLAAGALPPGRNSTDPIVGGLRPLFGDAWPEETLWVCAVRLDDGQRVVFGAPGAPRAGVPSAVAASCAIPGYFEPVTIGGVRYVDGGAHSPTNLDLVAKLGFDLVVVSSPMSASGRPSLTSFDSATRGWATAALNRELLALRRRGTPVVAFQPGEEDRRVMGTGVQAMDGSRRGPVARQVRQSVLARLDRDRGDLSPKLAALSG